MEVGQNDVPKWEDTEEYVPSFEDTEEIVSQKKNSIGSDASTGGKAGALETPSIGSSSYQEALGIKKPTAPNPIVPTPLVTSSQEKGLEDARFEKFVATLPDNLKKTDTRTYNLKGYWESLGKPEKFDYSKNKQIDGVYRADSRNPKTGEILKKKNHPTFIHALEEDEKIGYLAYESPNGTIYTFGKNDKVPQGFKRYDYKKEKPVAQKDESLRPDGTKKDIGFLGEFKTPSGKSVTEYSIGVPINGKEMDIPTLVPTLTEEEKKYIIDKAEKEEQIGRDAIGSSIVKKSIAHAEQRIKEGKSPFFSSSEKTKEDSKTAFEKYNLSYQKYKLDNDTFENALDITATNKLTLGEQASDFLGDIFKYARVPSMEEALKGNKYEQAKKEALSDSYIKKLSENLGKSKQDYILSTKELDKTIKKQSEEIAKSLGGWDKLVREDGDADVDKIRDGVDSYFEKIGIPTDSPAAYKLRSEIKGQAEFKKIEPKINASFDKEYYKLFGTTPESDLKTEYALTIENAKELKNIKANLDKQREIENSALKNEYQPEYEELGALYKTKTSEIELAIENDTEINSYAESLQNEKLKELQAAVDANKITVEQANQELNSPKQKEFVKAEVLKRINEKYSKVYENAFVDYQKQINEVASRYKSAYRIQENKRIEEANKKIEEEVKRLGGQYKVSDKIIERRKKAYEEAYKNVSNEQDAAKLAAARGLNFLSQAGASLLMGLGGGLKGYGAEFDNKTLYDIGESLESNFTIKVGESKEFSDWLDSNKLIVGSGNIIGRMIPGIGLTAGAAYLTKNWGLTSRLATTAVVGWTAETADMAGTIKNEVFEKTQDPVIAENAAKDMWRSQLYLFPLYGLEGAPYIDEFYTFLGKKILPNLFKTKKGARLTFGEWAKQTAGKTIASGSTELVVETFQEFPQNINEEAIRSGDEIKNITDQINIYRKNATGTKLKETFVQIAPSTFLMGSVPVFVSKSYGLAKDRYFENKVDSYITSQTISSVLDTSPEQYMFNIFREKGKNFAGTLLNTFYTSGKITEYEYDRLSEKLDVMNTYSRFEKKVNRFKTQSDRLSTIGYRLYDKYITSMQEQESEKDPLAKDILKKQAENAKKDLTEFFEGKGANVALLIKNGQEFVFTHDEMLFALEFENIKQDIQNGNIDILIGEFTPNEQSKKLIEELNKLSQETPTVKLNKNTTPTEEKYGTIDRGDGKGVVDLTRAEYEAELAKQGGVETEETTVFETDKTESRQPIDLSIEREDVIPQEQVAREVELKRKETEGKIKNKNLFLAEFDENGKRIIDKETGEESKSVGELISQSDAAPVPTSVKEINGIEFVEFSNPKTGDVDVIVTGKNDGSYVGFYRLYDKNGNPTNQWSSKFENPSRNKEDFKTMISGVQEMLPQGHEYTEKSSISTDGLRVWAQQLNRGYELQYDENGKLKTNLVAINGDAIVNELGIPVEKGQFKNIKVRTEEEFEIVKKAILPYLEKFGLNESNIKWLTGTVKIDLPILKQATTATQTEPTTAPTEGVEAGQEQVKEAVSVSDKKAEIERGRQEELKRMNYDELSEELKGYNFRLIGIKDKIGDSFRIIGTSANELIIDYILPDGRHGNFGIPVSDKLIEKYKDAEWSESDINAKYDAELARELYKEMKAGKLVADMTPAEQQVANKYITEELRKSVDAELKAGQEQVAPTTQEEKGASSIPSKTDKAYQEAQGVTERISKAHPEASVLILPEGNDLSLTALYVGKEKRGKGIGSGVLESVKAEADKLGKKVVLDATNELDNDTDLERLGEFYERNGFVKVGENKFEYTPKKNQLLTPNINQNETVNENVREIGNGQKDGQKGDVSQEAKSDVQEGEEKVAEGEEPTAEQVDKASKAVGTTPSNLRDLYRISRDLFGQSKDRALASAIAMDRMIGAMAKRAGILKQRMYEKLQFRKDTEANVLKADNALFQGMVDGKPVTLRNMDVDVVNGFYSPIEKNLMEYGKDKIKAKDWLNVVGKSDEAVFTGVRAFLEGKDPNAMVGKQEILDYMKDNRISVVEVVKGKQKVNKSELELTERPILGGWSVTLKSNGKKIDIVFKDEASSLEEAKEVAFSRIDEQGEDTTKFSQYQLEGEKENYKEVLVTLPNSQLKSINEYNDARDELDAFERSINIPTEEDKLRYSELSEKVKELEGNLPKNAVIQQGRAYVGEQPFQSTHFDEPNILVHLRMNTRTDADGNKVLFLEEVQSDWGQTGKKEGFEKPENTQAIEELKNEKQKVLDSSKSYQLLNDKTKGNLTEDVFDAIQQIATNMIDNPYSTEESRKERFLKNIENTLSYWSTYSEVPKMTQEELSDFYDVYIKELENNSKKISGYGTSYRLASLENKIEDINKKIYDFSAKKGVPTAPFVMDTNAWTKLGLKVALKEAVAQGVDKIAWTTGTQQFDRWGTEKIDWVKKPEFSQKRYDELRQKIKEDKASDLEIYEFQSLTKSKKGGWTINIQEQFRGTAFEGMNVDEKAITEKGITINSKEDLKAAIDRTLSREKTETERQKLTDRIWDRMQKEDSGTSLPRKEGMESFYGTEGTKGIVGGVAEKLFGQKVGTTTLQGEKPITTDNTTVEIGNKSYVLKNENGDNLATMSFETGDNFSKKDLHSELVFLAKKYAKKEVQETTQPSIDVTPALRAEVIRGLALFQRQQGQQAKGAMVAADGALIIYALSDPNVSTPLHEMAHVFEHYLTESERQTIIRNAGTGAWTTETSEYFARGFEKYLAEGVAPNKELQKVFEKFKEWLTEIYNGITGSEIDIQLNDEMRAIYAQMFGEEEVAEGGVVGGEVKDYKGIFNPKKTGLTGLDNLLEDDGYNYFYKSVRGEVVMMSPDEYLKRVREGLKTKEDANVTEDKKNAINKAINEGNKINMPFISEKDGKFSQEGRNRAVVARERGEKLIPVFIEKDVSFDDKIAKGKEYINSAIQGGATTKDDVLSKLKEQGLHRDAIRFIDNNFDNKAVEQLLSKPNEKITQKEDGKPLPEGVSGVRTETEERKTSPELRPQEEEARSIIDNAVANFYAINEATKRSEKREAAKEYRQNLEKMPTVKNIFDNIKTIFAQLEAEGVITKSKDCP